MSVPTMMLSTLCPDVLYPMCSRVLSVHAGMRVFAKYARTPMMIMVLIIRLRVLRSKRRSHVGPCPGITHK